MIIPQVVTGKKPGQRLNLSQILTNLPSDTPFGNLMLKHMKIVDRIDRVNSSIELVFSSYSLARIDDEKEDLMRHQLITEEIIYWLRKTADELISLQYVLYVQKQAGAFPRKVEVDCIDSLNNSNQEDFKHLFINHASLLKILNEVSNAYKHSFLNSDISLVGNLEPYVFALSLKRNNLEKQPVFHSCSFRDLIEEFNKFFLNSTEQLRKYE